MRAANGRPSPMWWIKRTARSDERVHRITRRAKVDDIADIAN
jgi:hypothetical protein